MITIVGLGVVEVDQVTPEAERALRGAPVIVHAHAGLATDAWLRTLGPLVVRGPDEVDELAVRVVDAAMTHGAAVLALAGHPTLGEPTTRRVHDLCAALGLPMRLVAGVSALGALFATVLQDPLTHGLQVFDAWRVVGRPLLPDVPLWLLNLHPDRRSRPPEAFAALRDHLLGFWGTGHPVLAVHAASHPLATPGVQQFALGDLCAWAPAVHPDGSLFLPV